MKTILLLLLVPYTISANDCVEYYHYKIENKNTKLCVNKKTNALVSKHCFSGKCDSLKVYNSGAIGQIKIKTSDLSGGRNPSTEICKRLKGTLILGTSKIGNQQYFCRFKDNSLVSTASLYVKYQDK